MSGEILREARAGDGPEACRIVEAVFREYGMTFDSRGWDRDLAEPERHYQPPRAVLFVAEESPGKLLGIGGAHVEETHAELHRLYIDPIARGRGLGRALCARSEDWAIQRGARRMILWSDVRFSHAHALYRSFGYRIFGARIIADPDRSVEFGFERDLAAPRERARDPLTEAFRSTLRRIPEDLARQSDDLWHKARHTAAGILDSRTLVATGRLHVGSVAHELPEVHEVFPSPAPAARLDLVIGGEPRAIVGFRRSFGTDTVAHAEEAIHPSCR